MPTVSGMKAGGFYDEHSGGQRSSIERLMDWIEEAAQDVAIPPADVPLALVDYGCSEGKNSLAALARGRDALRKRGATHAICPMFSDLATNNFNRLFDNLREARQLASDLPGSFPLAVGGSFYGPLLPPRSVHLAITFNSVLWLDALPPAPIPDFLVYPGPQPHRADVHLSAEAIRAFSAQAQRDLERFLEYRAVELAPGGRLIVATPAREGQRCTCHGLYDVVHDACLDLVQAGRIDRTAYEAVLMPIYFRTLEELLAPVQASSGPLAGKFVVEKAVCEEVPVAFVEAYRQTGDLARYAEQFVGFVQAFTEPILRPALEPTCDAATIAAIYARAQERLRAEPERYEFHYLQAAVLLARQ
ncbi:MAG: hypothetical protein AB7O59_17405 [Pirellulales bacterium]